MNTSAEAAPSDVFTTNDCEPNANTSLFLLITFGKQKERDYFDDLVPLSVFGFPKRALLFLTPY